MKNLVNVYVNLLDELVATRQLPHYNEEVESSYCEKLTDLWNSLSKEDREVVERNYL